jgi:tryptophan synthase beta chain
MMTFQITPRFTPSGIPTTYYNLFADAGIALDPPLDPKTSEPIAPEKLLAVFPAPVLEQEMTSQIHVPIPEEVLEAYAAFRPTPLRRAHRLEQALGTRCRIYYKYEGASPIGSHKLNSALAQAYLNRQAGVKRLATETGAGQWGTALAYAAQRFGLDCSVYMVRVSYDQKPARRTMMELFGATVRASPSPDTEVGRRLLAERPDHPGSLSIAISEAVEETQNVPDTRYALGSVLNHVVLHQTIIGQEALRQMEELGEFPDAVVACHGGGSNFGGLAFPFVRHRIGGRQLQIVAAEPTSCPSLTRGEYRYDVGDLAGMTPMIKMHTLGADFVPDSIHAGGLRYHGASPMVSRLLVDGLIEARAYPQPLTFDAARKFALAEGLVPAPESAHAIAAAMEIAREADAEGRERAILMGVSGHGLLELGAYEEFLRGRLG